jgi:Family of unknown function (DUF6516)
MRTSEHDLEWLLAYDGRVHYFADGHFVKFEIRRVKASEAVPHGIAYSFTFHDANGTRLLGFDNAHAVPHAGGRYVKPKAAADHWHRTQRDVGRPYTFVSPAQLLDDFFNEVEKLCATHRISTEVVSDQENS